MPTGQTSTAEAVEIKTNVRPTEALLNAGALQRAIFNSANFSSIATDARGVIQIFNVGAERMLGYAAADVVNTFTPADISDPRELIARAIALSVEFGTSITPGFEALVFKASRGIEDIYELTYFRQDGSRFPAVVSVTALRDSEDVIIGYLLIGTDNTARKRAEEALLKAGALQTAIFNSPNFSSIATDANGVIQIFNVGAERLLGYTADDVVNKITPADISDPEEVIARAAALSLECATVIAPGFEALVFKASRGIEDIYELTYIRKDRSRFPAMVSVTALHDAENAIIGYLLIGTDNTARKQIEEEKKTLDQRLRDQQAVELLRTAEERMRFALEAAGVGIWDVDFTTGVHRWSETLEAHYGLPPGTFVGTEEAFIERIHPDDRESVLETLARAKKTGADFSIPHRAIWADGTVRWLSGSGRVHLGEHGEPLRGVGISLDVTDRRALETQYQQAQKMEAIGQLAGGVAHDFNNLLTAILGYCELLLTDLNPDDPRYADVAEIQKAGTSAARLTRQLLAFSRKQIIEPTRLDLNVVVADMKAMLSRLIREDVKVVLDLQPEPAPVHADRGQMEQIVLNLAVNARDAMTGSGTLTIATANVDLDENYAKTHLAVKPGPYVVLTVSDTGTGMPPQVLARLFEPFFTTKELGKGTGLGLATVHGIATQSGGSVNVFSEVGRGTSFKVYLPRAEGAETAVEGPPPVSRQRDGAQTVLVVEDAEGLRELARRLLQRHGYTVLVAANADEAIRLFEQNARIDVLLTDVVMPGGNGPELTRRLVERQPTLKIIYMTGYTADAIVHHGVLKPGIALLHKPFTADTLGRKLREVLDR